MGEYMFHSAFSFNSNISGWNVCNVVNMSSLFERATSFNIDISSWDIRNVQFMERMFKGATSFDQKICWDTNHVRYMNMIFKDSGGSFLPTPQCLNNNSKPKPSTTPSISPTDVTPSKGGSNNEVFTDRTDIEIGQKKVLQKRTTPVTSITSSKNSSQHRSKIRHILGYFFFVLTITIIIAVVYYQSKKKLRKNSETQESVLPVNSDMEMDII